MAGMSPQSHCDDEEDERIKFYTLRPSVTSTFTKNYLIEFILKIPNKYF